MAMEEGVFVLVTVLESVIEALIVAPLRGDFVCFELVYVIESNDSRFVE